MDKNKLTGLLDQLEKLKASLPGEEILSLVQKTISDKGAELASKMKEDVSLQSLDAINNKLDKFKQDFDLKPVIESINSLQDELKGMEDSVTNEFANSSQASELTKSELTALIENTKNDLQGMTGKELANLLGKITALETQLNFQDSSSKQQGDSLKSILSNFETRLTSLGTQYKTSSKAYEDSSQHTGSIVEFQGKTLESLTEGLETLRKEMLARLKGGGSMNRQINVNSSVMSKKFTDVNFLAGTNVTLSATDDNTLKRVNITINSTGGSGSTLITTTDIYVDGNRVDAYAATGSIQYPYKTIAAAVTAINTLAPAGYMMHLSVATYVESVVFPAFPAVIYGNGSTIVGNVTLSKAFDLYDLTIVGNITQSDTSLTVLHAFESGFISGNVTISGLTNFNGMASDATGVTTINAGGVAAVSNSAMNNRIVNSGTLYFNNGSITRTDNANYLIDSSANGSLAFISICKLTNLGSGGGINIANNAGATQPNEISSMDVVIGGTTNGITCGAGQALLTDYNIFGSGGQIYATGTALKSAARFGIAFANGSASVLTMQPASALSSWTMTLPTTAGSNGQILQTDGNGITSWTNAGGSGITRVTSILSVSSTLAAVSKTDYVIFANVGINVTLPTAIGNTNLYTIKNIVANNSVLVSTSLGETIDGSASALMPVQNQTLGFTSNGSVWQVV